MHTLLASVDRAWIPLLLCEPHISFFLFVVHPRAHFVQRKEKRLCSAQFSHPHADLPGRKQRIMKKTSATTWAIDVSKVTEMMPLDEVISESFCVTKGKALATNIRSPDNSFSERKSQEYLLFSGEPGSFSLPAEGNEATMRSKGEATDLESPTRL